MSQDGQKVALTRYNRAGDSSVWLFDFIDDQIRRFPGGLYPALSPDGEYLLAGETVHDLARGSQIAAPIRGNYFSSVLTADAQRLIFTSNSDLDPSRGNSDQSTELFEAVLPKGEIRQLTSGPRLNTPQEVRDPTADFSGEVVLFSGCSSSQGGCRSPQLFQLFTATTDLSQLSAFSEGSTTSLAPDIASDGGSAVFVRDGLFVVNLRSRETTQLLDQSTRPSHPQISADGTRVAAIIAADLDPENLNEDLSPELFVKDNDGRWHQVTDRIQSFFAFALGMSGLGDSFVASGIGLDAESQVTTQAIRIVERHADNSVPQFAHPAPRVTVAAGESAIVPLKVTDVDEDRLYWIFDVPGYVPSGAFAESQIRETGYGEAYLVLRPSCEEIGNHRPTVAAFDEFGAFTVATLDLKIVRTKLPWNRYQEAVAVDLFERLATGCSDINRDSRVTAADLIAGIIDALP
ncbi:MAG TPA: hypothetical protein VEB21_03660 [Terriglobales bacterium]|nr:hypothetical protein [Terriglobales bacterium]